MRIRTLPEDFVIEEDVEFPGLKGTYAYYRVEKRGVSTVAVQEGMASQLGVTPSALAFLTHKAVRAAVVQYASVRKRGPQEIAGEGYTARRVGWGPRVLRLKDLTCNHITLVARDLSVAEAAALVGAMADLGAYGLPNYFDDARFGSRSRRDFIGKEILKRDAERVIHMYLAESLAGDPQEVREFKRLVKSHWGQWGYLLHQAPRPSNFRSVMTYLKDNPHDYRKAVNLIQDKLLAAYLAAYQAWVWNLILASYLDQSGLADAAGVAVSPSGDAHRHPADVWHAILRIARTAFPVPKPRPAVTALCEVAIDLPRLTAHYPGDFEAAAAAAFEREGLTMRDFKARILRRVYLPKDERALAFVPQDVACTAPAVDETASGRHKVAVSFALPPGQSAPLVLKAAAALTGVQLRQ